MAAAATGLTQTARRASSSALPGDAVLFFFSLPPWVGSDF